MTKYENILLTYMDDIKQNFKRDDTDHRNTIQAAITAVKRGVVQNQIYNSARNSVVALLKDKGVHTVSIEFSADWKICSCGSSAWCLHKLIVIFHLYAENHSLIDWAADWQGDEPTITISKIDKRTPEAWNDTLAQLMNPIRVIGFNENPAVFIHKFSLIEQKSATLYPFEWEWKPVFDLYYRLHALEAAWPYLAYHLANDENSFSYGKWYVRNWLSEQFNQIEDSIRSLSSKRQLFELDPFYKGMREMIRSFTTTQTGLFTERFRLYRNFWKSLFNQKGMREKEMVILAETASPIVQPLLAFFYIMDEQYDNLTKTTSALTQANIGVWFPLAEVADDEDDHEALAIIMHALLPFIPDFSKVAVPRSERAMFARRIDGLLEAADFPEEEREKLFFIYGDMGIDVYADFLVERERYAEWSALMHRYRVPYEIAEAGGLPLALKNNPVATFPLLHLYAMNFIAERNRQSYRRAVSVFRKMKNGAKKSGKHEFWNQYLETVRNKNRRLRALMEELEKGNLTL